MDNSFINKAIPDLDVYKLWMNNTIEPIIDNDLPPWATPGHKECKTTYSFNNLGLRCDDFDHLHKNVHIVYSGCEDTFGENIDFEHTWPYLLHSKINKNNSLISISYPSGGLKKILTNLFKYFIEYGNPDKIFLMMPSIVNDIGVIPEYGVFKPKIYRQHIDENLQEHNLMAFPHNVPLTLLALNFLERIRYLEEYCYVAKIDLKWTCSDPHTIEFLRQYKFRFFFEMDQGFDGNLHESIFNSFMKRI